jgi:hypothetical protein
MVVTTLLSALSATEKPDPILADLTTTGIAHWESEWSSESQRKLPPNLHITVDIQGAAANQASEYGELRLDSVLDENGKSYRRQCLPYGPNLNGMTLQLHSGGQNESGLSFTFRIRNRPPIQSIRELRGSLAVVTGREFEKVVVQNAFKNLGDPAKGETDSDDFGTMIRDKRLKALGVTLNVARCPVEKWASEGTKDCISVRLESSPYVVTGCEILDAKGKEITELGSSQGGSKPRWSFGYEMPVVVPADAQLRLTLQKNAKKIRIPFVVNDVKVPKVEKRLDIPASADNAYVEAETLPADSPILAGLKLNAKAVRGQWADNVRPPYLTVHVELQGKTADEASAFGEFDIESAVDESGNSLVFPSEHAEMTVRFHDKDRLRIGSTLFSPPPKREIRELRGSMALQIGDPTEVVTVKNFLDHLSKDKPLDNADLKALGIVVTLDERKAVGPEYGGVEAIHLDLTWKRNAVVLCQVCDSAGTPLETGSRSLSYLGPTSVACFSAFKNPLPPDAQLKLSVQKNTRKVRVPFHFKNIEVPPIPTR